MNVHAIRAIYVFEMMRTRRTLMQSIISPVISTALYFVVFGAAIGSRIPHVEGISYGAFIVPGLIMLALLTQSISNASFGIYFPRFTGTIYEILAAPISAFEIVLGYVGAAATKSVILGVINKGEIILVEDKLELMRKLGEKQLRLHLPKKLDVIPPQLAAHQLALTEAGDELVYTFDTQGERTGITTLLEDIKSAGITFNDLNTTQSSLEDIFVGLVRQKQ